MLNAVVELAHSSRFSPSKSSAQNGKQPVPLFLQLMAQTDAELKVKRYPFIIHTWSPKVMTNHSYLTAY